ncbi:putative membrane channel-forming protein YqfA (hemolysin III family) [Arthrobacter tumbae]|nr:putative membrane channel-forming protein YqfA (hemolysin III family) [Arthrobacter tumbae]
MKAAPPTLFISITFVAAAILFATWSPVVWWRVLAAVAFLVLGVWGVIVAIRGRQSHAVREE